MRSARRRWSCWAGFTKLVSALIKSYTDKYDLLLDSELLSSIRRMQDRIRSDPGEQTILDGAGRRSAPARELGFPDGRDVRRRPARMESPESGQPDAGSRMSPPTSSSTRRGASSGRVIATNQVADVPDLSTETRFRFHASENLERTGSFLCIPISSMNRCYGALTLESRHAQQFYRERDRDHVPAGRERAPHRSKCCT